VFGSRYYGDRYYAPRYWGKGAVATVEVPDVANDPQADGTLELEGAGFVVAVATEYSSIVPAGIIISQNPVGGSFAVPGSTVTITVSLGDAPAADETNGGGPDWEDDYRLLKLLRKRFRERKEAREAEAERIRQAIEGPSIEVELQAVETQVERAEERAAVVKLAESVRKSEVTERVRQAAEAAFESRSRSSLERFERELRNMIDEEDAAIAMLLSLDD
jgi:hypothetical protein